MVHFFQLYVYFTNVCLYFHLIYYILISTLDPIIMPRMQVDKGAIKFILSGANIMCRGFTSKGGAIPTPLEANSPVVSIAMHQIGIDFD
jgi:predicted RNA-binding protein (TIGR00451 family)